MGLPAVATSAVREPDDEVRPRSRPAPATRRVGARICVVLHTEILVLQQSGTHLAGTARRGILRWAAANGVEVRRGLRLAAVRRGTRSGPAQRLGAAGGGAGREEGGSRRREAGGRPDRRVGHGRGDAAQVELRRGRGSGRGAGARRGGRRVGATTGAGLSGGDGEVSRPRGEEGEGEGERSILLDYIY